MRRQRATRRDVLLGAGALGAGAALAACGGGQNSAPSTSQPTTTSTSGSAAASGGVNVDQVPLGGGIILTDQDVAVTQPQPGQFKAFSATCTHQGCIVGSVTDGTINCPCHGSKFNITDGSVVNGPAAQPLPAKTVMVTGDTLTIT
ncbi:MAG: Rieske (2Fe-2S) protein [Mycobacteriaceae bacterium]|nr:Rieske (2Fe-2S) protein [Mycobacteriaceae bacterium]MBV9641763.1 Rieske (2Fe-2S) protein [Mycobacteriaceae bacterium]